MIIEGNDMQEKNSWENTLGMRFCLIPGGCFIMGEGAREEDEKPEHSVTISREYWMQETPVTNKQYEEFDPLHVCHRDPKHSFGEDACTNVTWYDACAFAEWLSKKENKKYRLPTEAEWEYACRAGTHTAFSCGDTMEEIDFVQEDFFPNECLDMRVAQKEPNPWGLYDMHGLVEEWCFDWYAPYNGEPKTDPGGATEGLYRVTRGGSVNTSEEYLRSANRMAAMPETRNSITGFRLVRTEIMPVLEKPRIRKCRWQQNVSQKKASYRITKGAVFKEPLVFVRPPEELGEGPFYPHNHVPSIAVLNNGDLFATWFSAKKECGRELTVLASRFRLGAEEWDTADEFYKIADRNMSSTAIFCHPDGRLFHFNGISMSGTEFNLVSIFRVSKDNGVTWSKENYVNAAYSTNKPICAPTLDHEGRILLPADMYDLKNKCQGTVLFRSDAKLETFEEQTVYGQNAENFLKIGESAGWIAGVHAAVLQLKDGRLVAYGRSESRCGRQVINGKMPMSISEDLGKNWKYYESPFPPIGYGQRCCLLRLTEGPIVFFSFTDPQYEIIAGRERGMDLTDAGGNVRHGYGLYAAVSFDECKTWPVQQLITTGTDEAKRYDPGASCPIFLMDKHHGQPMGYLQAVQSPDLMIHLISSRLHYRFNLEWLLSC